MSMNFVSIALVLTMRLKEAKQLASGYNPWSGGARTPTQTVDSRSRCCPKDHTGSSGSALPHMSRATDQSSHLHPEFLTGQDSLLFNFVSSRESSNAY